MRGAHAVWVPDEVPTSLVIRKAGPGTKEVDEVCVHTYTDPSFPCVFWLINIKRFFVKILINMSR